MAPTSTRKASKPSGVVKQKKRRPTTATTKNHRFQTFSERISNLKIDPIRRRRPAEAQPDTSETSTTYFGQALEEWQDRNMSATFTAFAKEVAPLCDNLPMLLHNEGRIMDSLDKYIAKENGLAMEPLLNLLSLFAHDLDVRFEKHFPRAVQRVAGVAAKHSDLAVVEWSFTCLAWLFKYLSRLLAPNLRPLYDLMAPYLGKAKQKPYVVRFAAESLSFLVRKAAATYNRDQTPLDSIIAYMLEDCASDGQQTISDLLPQGVMTLLTDAIQGVQHGIHSSGQAILRSLLKHAAVLSKTDVTLMSSMVCGVLTSLIHFCTAETFVPVLEVLLSFIEQNSASCTQSDIHLQSSILFTAISVRKGSRIEVWKPVMSAVSSLIQTAANLDELSANTAAKVLGCLAVAMQTATIDAVLASRNLLSSVCSGKWMPYFFSFCDLFARLGKDRFDDFVLPLFQKTILNSLGDNEEQALALVLRLSNGNSVTGSPGTKLKGADGIVEGVLSDLDLMNGMGAAAVASEARLPRLNARMAALSSFAVSERQRGRLRDSIVQLVHTSLTSENHGLSEAFVVGPCLQLLLDCTVQDPLIASLWPELCKISPRLVGLPLFWSNILRFLKIYEPASNPGPHMSVLESALVRCLASPSHSIRTDVLDIWLCLYKLRGKDVPDVLSVAATIESIPVSLETARSLSLHIRKLAPDYQRIGPDDAMLRAIPHYCFGLLHLHLAQAWEDAGTAIATMAESKAGEETIMNLVESWLDSRSEAKGAEMPKVLDVNSDGFRVFSDFECPNLAKMEAVRDQVFLTPFGGLPSASEKLNRDHERVPHTSPNTRSQALRVLQKITKIAEKRSRILVPVLLDWAGAVPDAESKLRNGGDRWSRKDQKAMLSIFAEFVNPKVLFRSGEVFDALLNLCANGDVEIQRSALKAVLAWKDPSVTRYAENLTNVLDEARFREEISVFLKQQDEDEGIRFEDQPNLMQVLLRLLYGRAIAGRKDGQSNRRKAIFVALSRFGEEVIKTFLEIALSPIGSLDVIDKDGMHERVQSVVKVPLRQQLGMLNMLNDMLQTLAAELAPRAPRLVQAILACTVHAAQRLGQQPAKQDALIDEPAPAIEAADDILDVSEVSDSSLLRAIRQTGIQCLVKVFASMDEQDTTESQHIIVQELIIPRLDTFAEENAQSISGTLRLFAAWAGSDQTSQVFLDSGPGSDMLRCVAELLRLSHTKDAVRLFALQEILDRLASDKNNDVLLRPFVSDFVISIGKVIDAQPSKDVLDASVKSFSQLADRIVGAREAAEVVRICTDLLKKPSKAVSPPTKAGLLRTLQPLLIHFKRKSNQQEELYRSLSTLFSRLQHSETRSLLSDVLDALVLEDEALQTAAKICMDLNAIGSRLDGSDLDRRELAFASVYEKSTAFTLAQWLPVVHNCLHFLNDAEDRVNRLSASHALRLFIEASKGISVEWTPLLDDVMLSLERAMRNPSELVRAESLVVLGHMVDLLPDWPRVGPLSCLSIGGDEEASFFTNILHIQQHRRLRALRRLGDASANLNSASISKLFLPLLEHFIFDPVEGDAGRTLADQTIETIGSLAGALTWSAWRATFQRYAGYLKSKEEQEKKVLRLLGALVDNGLKDSNPKNIIEDQLPPLTQYLHQKDESTVDRRMPVAITITKLLLALPIEELRARLPAVLLDVCYVLKSRSQEARDQARKALASISSLIGAAYFGFILKTLRTVLDKGYQLHVLSYTVHSLLVHGAFGNGDLDECLTDLTAVIESDIFGATGQEKEAEEYKSSMKEVKSSKSFDTMELVARITSISKLVELVRPLQSLLSMKVEMNTVKKVDELLIRLRKGLDQNPASESRDILTFCWQMINRVHIEDSTPASTTAKLDERTKRYIIGPEEPKKSKTRGATASYRFKLVSFALNLVRKVVRRHEDLQTPQNMAGFLPVAGDALIIGQEEVKVAAARLLSTIMSVEIPQLRENAPVYLKEAVALISAAPSTTTDAAKASLELITAVLREKRDVAIREKDMAVLLKRLKPDLDEPDRQGIIYKFLRAVLGRKIVITEVYEVMDEVGKVMITNPDRSIRESARSAYEQFVMEYPQGKDRWQKQTAFLVGNLQYEHAAGRQSVMEFLNRLLTKIGDDGFTEITPKLFVSLLPVLVSDSDLGCREFARILVGKIFERISDKQLLQFESMMDTWLQRDKKPTTKSGSLQCWSVLLEAKTLPRSRLESLRDKIEEVLSDCSGSTQTISEPALAIVGLQTLQALVERNPGVAFARDSNSLWDAIQRLPAHGDPAFQELAARLLGSLFSEMASASSKTADGLAGLPLRGTGGLEIGAEDMRRLCAANLRFLRTISLATGESLSAQMSRNIVFLGRCFAANAIPWREEDMDDESDVDDDAVDQDPPRSGRTALSHLLIRLSSIVQQDKWSVVARSAALQCEAALLHQLPDIPDLQAVLRPLYALTDPSVPKPPGDLHQALSDKAQEVLEHIQKKLGPEAYVTALAETRAQARARRDERRLKRRIDAVSAPEKWAEAKKRKHEVKKVKRKVKGEEARGRRRGW